MEIIPGGEDSLAYEITKRDPKSGSWLTHLILINLQIGMILVWPIIHFLS